MTDYLISIASNYWTSQFARDFPDLAIKGFKSAGKFGIGFLSVFMLGDEVSVESNRTGEERYKLSLRGVGRRGELQKVQSPSGSGTLVRVTVSPRALKYIRKLDELIPLYAPTLPHDVKILVDGKETLLKAGWLNKLGSDEFHLWTARAERILTRSVSVRSGSNSWSIDDELEAVLQRRYLLGRGLSRGLDDGSEERLWKLGWPEFVEGKTRLIASFSGVSILSLRGLAIQPIRTPGYAGVIELDSAETDVSRSRTIGVDITPVIDAACECIRPQVTRNLEKLSKSDIVVNYIDLLGTCVRLYGRKIVGESDILWINKITAPGNVQLVSCSDLLASASTLKSVFVTFNLGPWTAMKKWAAAQGPRDPNEIAIALDAAGQRGPDYRSPHETKIGSLMELWDDCYDSPLFGAVIDVIAQAWQVSPSELTDQPGWTHEGTNVYGRLTR